jgi:transcriptional regulator with XRE-family HTH domain
MQPRGIQVAPLIRAARRGAGLSVAQLAEELGVGKTTVRDLETGRRTVTGVEVRAIARAIETSVAPLEDRIRRARVDGRIVELEREVSWIERTLLQQNGDGHHGIHEQQLSLGTNGGGPHG